MYITIKQHATYNTYSKNDMATHTQQVIGVRASVWLHCKVNIIFRITEIIMNKMC